MMSSRSSGYSNAAYSNLYDNDPDDQDNYSLFQCTTETFVDEMYADDYDQGREAPLGASGTVRYAESHASTPSSTPRKSQIRRQRSFSAPRTRDHGAVNVLAPMIAQARSNQEAPGIRRARSAVFVKEGDDRRVAEPRGDLAGQRGHHSRRTIAFGQNQGYRVVPTHRHPGPVVDRTLDSSFHKPRQPLVTDRNLAIIPPNTRPLLSPVPSALHGHHSPQKPSSWSPHPATHRPANTLWLSGLFLLFTSSINCLLCFYLLAKKGRHYYIDFAVISGFVMLVLGFVAVRVGRWDWLLNRNYLAGYMVLSMLDVLLCAVLGLVASDWRPPEVPGILEVASGAVCGLSALMLLLALCLGASSCCRSPPPDNRVAHSVPTFIV